MTKAGPRSLLELIAQSSTLESAWRSVRGGSSSSSSGLDNITLTDFARNWQQKKKVIRQRLLDKSYKFTPYLGQPLKKKTHANPYNLKEWRPISIATISDRVVQRAILDRIWKDIRHKVHTEVSFGGIRKYKIQSRRHTIEVKKGGEDEPKSVLNAAKRIVELREKDYNWVFETDIENFFPTVDRGKLFAELFPMLRDNSINHLIESALDTSIANAAQLGLLSNLWDPTIGVPQGGVLSPMLANFYLFEHDKILIDAGFHLIRYVDDLVILTQSEQQARAAYRTCKLALEEIGLKIHPLGLNSNGRIKTNIRAPSESFDFLGLTFYSNSIRPMQRKFDSLHERLMQITETQGRKDSLFTVIQQVNWCVRGWVKAYDFCNLSRRHLELIDQQAAFFIRRWLQRRGIIAKINKLDNEAYGWLGIERAQDIFINPILKPVKYRIKEFTKTHVPNKLQPA